MTAEWLVAIPLRAIVLAFVSLATTGVCTGIGMRRDSTPGQSGKAAAFVASISLFTSAGLVSASLVTMAKALFAIDPYGAVVAAGTLFVLYLAVAFLAFLVGALSPGGRRSTRRQTAPRR